MSRLIPKFWDYPQIGRLRKDPNLALANSDPLLIARGLIDGVSIVHKFGRNDAVGTSFVPVAMGAAFQTPPAASATTLRIKAGGDANDTAAGSGARSVLLQGLDETGAEVTETLATAGTSASAVTTTTFMRLYRAYVTGSGTYATAGTQSHADDIVIENGAGGTDWLTIDATDMARGQSEVALYTIPLGKTGYVKSIHISVASNKTADVLMFKRESILDSVAPYQARRLQIQFGAVAGEASLKPFTPMGPFHELTDIGFMAKAALSAEVDVDFEIILFDD